MKMVQPGAAIAGKYVVERVIGRGGVGIIAAARHVTLNQLVALKFLRPEIQGDWEVTRRFIREAQAAAQIRSEHVTRVMDAGALEDGTVFLVFEYLAGRDLAAVLREDGPLPVADAVDYLMQACEAIGEAHALGIVHRDLKPANLFLTQSADGAPFVKVLDFGLSKFNRSAAATLLTADNHLIGSPHFMSPEQMRSSREADARSDIWALGVVLFGLLTGRVPFEGEYLTEICASVLAGEPRSLRALRPEAPPELEAVILRCLQTDPAERLQSVTELADALRPFNPTYGHLRAERIARVIVGTQLALELGPTGRSAPLLPVGPASLDDPTVMNPWSGRSRETVGHGSSSVSWTMSVERAHGRADSSRPPLDETRADITPIGPAPPPRVDATLPTHRGSRTRSLVFAVGAVSIVAGLAGTLWLELTATRAAVSSSPSSSRAMPLATVRSEASAAVASAEASSFRAAPPVAVVISSNSPPARGAAPSGREALTRTPRATNRPTPVPPSPVRPATDEEWILRLPH